MGTTYTCYRAWLRDELAARCSRNPLYSLRAFARDIDLRPSHLSEMLKGRLGLSVKSAEKIGAVIGLSASEQSHFITLVEASDSRNQARRKEAKAKLKKQVMAAGYRTLDEQVFEVISDWQHYAIMELVLTENFVPKLSWISERLGLSRPEVESAVRRLKNVGLLKVEKGKWQITESFPATTSDVPSSAIKKFHTQILEKAQKALYLQTVEERDFSTMTFPINPADLKSIKEEIRDFRRALAKKYKDRANKREVYAMSVQFFSLTQKSKMAQAQVQAVGVARAQ